jgi:hypothetical protein
VSSCLTIDQKKVREIDGPTSANEDALRHGCAPDQNDSEGVSMRVDKGSSGKFLDEKTGSSRQFPNIYLAVEHRRKTRLPSI